MTGKEKLPISVLIATTKGMELMMEFCEILTPGSSVQKGYLNDLAEIMNFIQTHFPTNAGIKRKYNDFLARIEEKVAADHGPDPAA